MLASLQARSLLKERAGVDFMQQFFKTLTTINAKALQAINQSLRVHEQICELQKQIEVLVLFKNTKLQLHLYLLNNEDLQLWACRISDN